MAEELELLSPEELAILTALEDPRCVMCGFQLHSHGRYSRICPIPIGGMLRMFQKEENHAKDI